MNSALRHNTYIMYMNRNRTIRKHHDLSGATIFKDYSQNDGLQEMLKKESEIAFKKPWHRLERGMRLNRLRLFSEMMKDTKGLQENEVNDLILLLSKSLDKKLLNSKNSVIYDIENEKILEIKNLVMHQNADGSFIFQLLDIFQILLNSLDVILCLDDSDGTLLNGLLLFSTGLPCISCSSA